jgi:serine/threonine-protein phosphatase 2B regulatory subunit
MIDFKEFVKALSTFNPQQNNEEDKLKFLFKVYDLDQDGLLSQDEIRIILKQVVAGSLNDSQLR